MVSFMIFTASVWKLLDQPMYFYQKCQSSCFRNCKLILKYARDGKIVVTRPADINVVELLSLKYMWAFYTGFFFNIYIYNKHILQVCYVFCCHVQRT